MGYDWRDQLKGSTTKAQRSRKSMYLGTSKVGQAAFDRHVGRSDLKRRLNLGLSMPKGHAYALTRGEVKSQLRASGWKRRRRDRRGRFA